MDKQELENEFSKSFGQTCVLVSHEATFSPNNVNVELTFKILLTKEQQDALCKLMNISRYQDFEVESKLRITGY